MSAIIFLHQINHYDDYLEKVFVYFHGIRFRTLRSGFLVGRCRSNFGMGQSGTSPYRWVWQRCTLPHIKGGRGAPPPPPRNILGWVRVALVMGVQYYPPPPPSFFCLCFLMVGCQPLNLLFWNMFDDFQGHFYVFFCFVFREVHVCEVPQAAAAAAQRRTKHFGYTNLQVNC